MSGIRFFRSLNRRSSNFCFLQQLPLLSATSYPFHSTSNYQFAENASQKDNPDPEGGPKKDFTGRQRAKSATEDAKALVKFGQMFDNVPQEDKNKENFERAIGVFLHRNVHRRGQVEFIYAALKHMKEFGVLRDLDCYKRLIDIFPKGKMIAENMYQLSMKHYPKHQDCCVDVLDQMEHYACFPDKEIYNMVENAFGKNSFSMMKMKRMMYWMPKFRYANPYRFPYPLPTQPIELAKLAIERMCRDPANEVYVWYTEALINPPEKTWIVCGQSCHQRQLINEHSESKPLYVDGPFREWIFNQNLSYFVLLADASPHKFYGDIEADEPETADEWATWETKFSTEFPESRKDLIKAPMIHEQEDGTILSIGITGSSSKESLTCWINFLQRTNPKLETIPVVFRLAHGISDLVVNKEDSDKSTKEIPAAS